MDDNDSEENKELEESSEEEDQEDFEEENTTTTKNTDETAEGAYITKLMKYVKYGNATATVLALCALLKCDLTSETCCSALKEGDSLEVLLNILDTEELKCQMGALRVLLEVSPDPGIRSQLVQLKGVQSLVRLLYGNSLALRSLAARTLSLVAISHRARKTVLHLGGIQPLIQLLESPHIQPIISSGPVDTSKKVYLESICSSAHALWTLSHGSRNRKAIKNAHIVPLLAKLLKAKQYLELLIPVVGLIQQCSSESHFRTAFRQEGIIEDICAYLKGSNIQLLTLCSATIFKCGQDHETREMVGRLDGLQSLVALMSKKSMRVYPELMVGVTGALWTCAESPANAHRIIKLGAVEELVSLLKDQSDKVLVNVVGCLSYCAENEIGSGTLRRSGGLPPMVALLACNNQELLINIARTIRSLATDKQCMSVLEEVDCIRLLWSQLQCSRLELQAKIAWAVCACVENSKVSEAVVWTLVGGLELLMDLLRSSSSEVQAAICGLVAVVAKNPDCLGVLTDHGVVLQLASLAKVKDPILQCQVAKAVSSCCDWRENRYNFGSGGIIYSLVKYLQSANGELACHTVLALCQLSHTRENCVIMHKHKAVPHLLEFVGHENQDVQEAAVACLTNIRSLALSHIPKAQQV